MACAAAVPEANAVQSAKRARNPTRKLIIFIGMVLIVGR
jgi:hypothetical protein